MGRSLSLPSPSENGDGQDDGDEILEGNETQLTNLQKYFLGDDPVPILYHPFMVYITNPMDAME